MARSIALLVFLMACTKAQATSTTTTTTAPSTSASVAPPAQVAGPAVRSFFLTPSDGGLQPVVDAIAGAKKSIRMMMFHLTVPDVENALIAAKSRGVDVKIILDGKTLEGRGSAAVAQRLTDHGIEITKSSPAFSITHVKAMVVDEARATVMSLNLTRPFDHTRDYAIVTDDATVVDEILRVFQGDIDNAAAKTGSTPPLASPALVWSPVDSESRIVALVESARTSIIASTENLGDKPLGDALGRAAKRGVKVRIVAPMCDLGNDPLRNLPYVDDLDHANVDARVMPPPSTREQPYIHAKMMIVDGARGFIGSINFSENSMKRARELGIIFEDHAAIVAFTNAFEGDWRAAVPPPPKTGATHERKGEWKTSDLCPKKDALPDSLFAQ